MSKNDNVRPVSSIKHDDKRAAIPDSAHQGEEQVAISGQLEVSEYQVFHHEFQRGRDPELYWLGKYKNDAMRTILTICSNCVPTSAVLSMRTSVQKLSLTS